MCAIRTAVCAIRTATCAIRTAVCAIRTAICDIRTGMPLDYSRIHDANKSGQVRDRERGVGGGGGGERNWDRVRELLVTEHHKKRCVFPSNLCTRPKSKVSLCFPHGSTRKCGSW